MSDSIITQAIENVFPILLENEQLIVAYSGGVDSHVLLDALHDFSQQLPPIKVIHVNHGLSPNANTWQEHCITICNERKLSYDILSVCATPRKGESPEEAARRSRYQALSAHINERCCLLLAQHKDDQVETFLLQALRGAGVAGLASMPKQSSFAKGRLLRPFLSVTKEAILHYASAKQLQWIEDESNQEDKYDRNYLRNHIIPLVKKRWPGFQETITRSAKHCASAKTCLEEMAKVDLKQVINEDQSVSISKLTQLTLERSNACLRYWIAQMGFLIPSDVHIQRINQELLNAREDASPLITWENAEVRRYRDAIYIFKPKPMEHYETMNWSLHKPLDLGNNRGSLQCVEAMGEGLKRTKLEGKTVEVRFGVSGERIHPAGRQGSHPLKKCWQEWGVPPWERSHIPLLYLNGKLIAVVGYCIAEGWQATTDETAYIVRVK